MRVHRMLLALVAVAALSLAACGGAAPGGINSASVQAKVESTLSLKLTAVDIPADAKAEGVVTYLGNTSTMTTDKQVVQVFILDSEGKVAAAKDKLGVASGVPGMRIITHKNIVVLYAPFPGGPDNGAALEAAVNSL